MFCHEYVHVWIHAFIFVTVWYRSFMSHHFNSRLKQFDHELDSTFIGGDVWSCFITSIHAWRCITVLSTDVQSYLPMLTLTYSCLTMFDDVCSCFFAFHLFNSCSTMYYSNVYGCLIIYPHVDLDIFVFNDVPRRKIFKWTAMKCSSTEIHNWNRHWE